VHPPYKRITYYLFLINNETFESWNICAFIFVASAQERTSSTYIPGSYLRCVYVIKSQYLLCKFLNPILDFWLFDHLFHRDLGVYIPGSHFGFLLSSPNRPLSGVSVFAHIPEFHSELDLGVFTGRSWIPIVSRYWFPSFQSLYIWLSGRFLPSSHLFFGGVWRSFLLHIRTC
jgi:hypothetical protein